MINSDGKSQSYNGKYVFIGDKMYLPPDTFAITYRLRKSPVTPKEEQEILREYPYDVTFVSADFNNGGVC